MRSGRRPIVVWGVTLLAVTLVATRSLDRDQPVPPLARSAFTLYIVDQGGARQPVAHYDGLAWAPLCEQGLGPPTPVQYLGPVLAVEGSRGSPLYPVRLLSGEPRRWQRARDAVQALTDGSVDVPGRIREAAVYVPVGTTSDVVFVDLVMRSAEPQWWGVAASGWVHTDGDRVWVLAPRVAPFATYEDFIATPRLHPLGVADVGHPGERVWVMQNRAPELSAIELVRVSARTAETSVSVAHGGC
ncbi:MAG: hypothetical protein Q8L86_21240 [Vicinamibacterales bacterium]|nr:hypothetical protein [Vicinamibacterales bacterium]